MADVTDATFERDVIERSTSLPVVVDLWAEWCGPCKTLGPILERVIAETNGAVELAKVDVDGNPQVGAAFRVQSIPAVFALRDRQVVDHFIGALPEPAVREFVQRLVPSQSEAERLIDAGDEASLRLALELEPANERAVLAMAELLAARGEPEEALALLSRIPETGEARRVAALARTQASGAVAALEGNGIEGRLDALLDQVKEDEAARREFLDLLELMGPDDPRTGAYRRALTSRLF